MSDEWYTRFRVAWDPVSAPVEGYRLTYFPAGERSSSPGPDGFMAQISPQPSFADLQARRAPRWICLWGTSPPTPCTTFSLEPRMTSKWWLSTQEERAPRWPDRELHVRAHRLLGEEAPARGSRLTLLSSAVYLNVTNIETYNVDHDKFCIKWTPHRSATSYRIKLNPVDRKSPSCSGSSGCLRRSPILRGVVAVGGGEHISPQHPIRSQAKNI